MKYICQPQYRFTVDVEYDWGGRTKGEVGLKEGMPRILEIFKEAKIKGLFFISTEILETVPNIIRDISRADHEIGSHGHFHQPLKNQRWKSDDRKYSEAKLAQHGIKTGLYRAPKFGLRQDCIYSNPKGHVSLLKNMWFGQPIKPETIIYLHPFDIVHSFSEAPNLFCRLWYSRPDLAFYTFETLVNKYK